MAAADITYIYDELGRLRAVVDPASNTAVYNYDPVGNLTGISRHVSTQVSIIDFTPNSGPMGTVVTIYGTGFSTTPSQNTVTFNGVGANVTSSTSTQIVASLPAGATSGPIGVTTPTGSATSAAIFAVTTSGAPTITGFTPTIGTPGTAVTITGTNFDPAPANNKVTFNVSSSIVNSAASTTIATSVPTGTGSGRISVLTPSGMATSSDDFFIPPSPYVAGDVVFTGRQAIEGSSLTVTVSTANKIGLVVFDGTMGLTVNLGINEMTISQSSLTIYKPDGTTLTSSLVSAPGGTLNVTLPLNGTYTILVDPSASSTGSMTLTLGRPDLDPNSGVTEYTYDSSHRMLTIKDVRGIVFLTNEYDSNGRVFRQTQADTTTFQFSYTLNGSTVTQTDLTDPRGKVRRVTFNSSGYSLADTYGLGTPEAQTITYERQAGSNLLLSVTDALNRKASYTHDSMGNALSITRLADTPDAVTTTFTYEPTFSQVASITDPLNHTSTFGHDAQGNLTSVTNALNQTTTLTYNAAGQPISIKDPLNNTTQFTYDFGDLAAVTDPLGDSTTRFIDTAGRLTILTNPLGNVTRYDYDSLNRLTKVTDSRGGLTQFGYDPNGNLLSMTDAKNQATTYTYNNMDRLATRTDPLVKVESYQYDGNGNLSQFTDRKSQVTTYTYDALNRRTGVTYADGSTTTYTYDAGNRLTQVADSISGTISRTYDGLDRLTSETTPQGSVGYTYDAAGRRTSLTVSGQPSVVYSYDNANRLTQITQGSSVVGFSYDAAGRRTSLTLPNGILVEYAYDTASRVTGITYKQGTNVLGNLTYEYDKAGNRTKIAGSFARTGIPQSVASTGYNAANQQTTFGDKTLTYDNNGNLTSIVDAGGTTLYTWNARNQLTGIIGPGVSASFFAYDGVGRREKKTINANLTEFLYDGFNPVQETSGAIVLANILTGLGVDEFLTRTDVLGAITSHFLPDVLGSPVALTDAAGTVQTEYTYEPFGKTTSAGVFSFNPFQYTGRENDGTGLYYYRARYYHPVLQRFLSEDPLEIDTGDENLYAYVTNSPANYVDPSGEVAIVPLVTACLGGGIVNTAIDMGISALSGRKTTLGDIANSAAAGCVSGVAGFALGKTLTKGLESLQALRGGSKLGDALRTIKDFLGKDAQVITNKHGDKIFVSKDGTRRLRFDFNNPHPHQNPHAHVEELVNGRWIKSGPIYPKDVLSH